MAGKMMSRRTFRRWETRLRVIRFLERAAFLVFCLSAGFVVAATAFPQRKVLEAEEKKLTSIREQETIVYGERDQARTEFHALREDPAFLEIHARDRLDYYREGERIFRFRRGE